MGTEQFLTHEDKYEALSRLVSLLEEQAKKLCSEMEIDFDSIDLSTFATGATWTDSNARKMLLIKSCIERIAVVNQKLEELSQS
jgi:hypothetical protein